MIKKYIAIIYEGERTEKQLVWNLNQNFFSEQCELVPITFPAGENIYMLWKQLKKDEFETDVIEVLRESNKEAKKVLEGFERNDFMEIYLFFDYDGHNNNLKAKEKDVDILEEMLNTFNEETDLGKLYINYPMVESLRDQYAFEEENVIADVCLILMISKNIRKQFMKSKNIRISDIYRKMTGMIYAETVYAN